MASRYPRTMDVETAIRTRRTHKAFGPEPLPPALLDELLELASWAPNHNLTVPWRFRVVGPRTLRRLQEAAGSEGAAKLERCPTLVVVSTSVKNMASTLTSKATNRRSMNEYSA